ncbi:MAG: hypothetical protein IPI49_22420 [Myxococcales bacterium]|nr:hypothetical protein [Myxococcales bacterium]
MPDADFEAQATSIATAASAAGFRALPALARAQRHALQQALLGHHEVPLFSLMAHGRPSGGRLLLETAQRTAEDLDAPTLAADLRGANTQVALLWACHAARPHQELRSVAEQLLTESGNLAAVVAAHGALRADWVARASENLFASLARNGDLEQALSAGRRALNASDVHWAALAYYARPRHDRSVTSQQAADATVQRDLETRAQHLTIEDAPEQPRHWVPRPLELTEILAGLRSHRLVTLLGMPGIGKTELAREAAQRAVADANFALPRGLWIALDKVRSTAGLVARLARWAGLDEAGDAESKLVRAIGIKQALWVLDNAEDLLRTHRDAHALRQLPGAPAPRLPGAPRARHLAALAGARAGYRT